MSTPDIDPAQLKLDQAIPESPILDFSLETLQARIDKLLQAQPPIDPKTTTDYRGDEIAIEDLPTPELRASFGYGHFQPFNRNVIHRPDGVLWPYTPNMCLVADIGKGVWLDEDHLACPGCGLDFT